MKLQAAGEQGYSDVEIRMALLCMAVGGPPQPPMVVPQAMEQLLRRPDTLADAHRTAVATTMHICAECCSKQCVSIPWAAARRVEGLRPCYRHSACDFHSERRIVFNAFASAMMDERRLPTPQTFIAGRQSYEYIHFGYGLQECFGRHINYAILHRILKPLSKRSGLRRAEGKDGRLWKRGIFADILHVRIDNARPPSR